MKEIFYHAIAGAMAFVFVQAANAQTTLLTDDFAVTSNQGNPNYEITDGRQTGTQAPSDYSFSGNVQVGHTGVNFGNPGGATNGDFMLLAENSWSYNDLGLADSLLNGGSLTISFAIYTGVYPNVNAGDWLSFDVGPDSSSPWPTSNHFGLIVHQNGALDIYDGANDDEYRLDFSFQRRGCNRLPVGRDYPCERL